MVSRHWKFVLFVVCLQNRSVIIFALKYWVFAMRENKFVGELIPHIWFC